MPSGAPTSLGRPQLRALARTTLALVGSLWLGCGGDDAATERPSRPPAVVSVATVEEGPLRVRHDLPGRVRAARHATLGAGAAGAVSRVLVNVGDEVERGQLLFEVDPRAARADVAAARATVATLEEQHAQALRDAERYAEAGAEVVSAAEIQQLRSQAEQLDRRRGELMARVRQTRSRLAEQIVRAPFAGQVTSRTADPGDWLAAGAPVLTLVDTRSVDVHAVAAPGVVDALRAGATATIRYADEECPGTVAAVVRALDEDTGTAPVRIVPAEDPGRDWLLPGRFVRVSFELDRSGGWVVPRDAIVQGVRGTRVALVRDGQAQLVPVEVLVHSGDRSLVRPVAGGQLEAGDVVVTRGNERLRPEQPVSVAADSAQATNGSASMAPRPSMASMESTASASSMTAGSGAAAPTPQTGAR